MRSRTRTLILCAVALSVALALGAGAGGAFAGGPGVTLCASSSEPPITVSGDQISAMADVSPRPYTLRASPTDPGTTAMLGGLSIRGLLAFGGVDPDTIRSVTVIRPNGSLLALSRSDVAEPPPFPEGPALVSDNGAATRFLRPVRGLRSGTNATDDVRTTDAAPLDVSVDGCALLAVKLTATRTRVSVGDSVRFSARVEYPPPGVQLTYRWTFEDDATPRTGAQLTHTFATPGDFQVQVSVSGTGGTTAACANSCGGLQTVDVRVGDPPSEPEAPDPSPGSGSGSPLAPGSATGTGAGGQGGSGGSAGGTSTAPATSPKPRTPAPVATKPPPPPPPKKPFGPTITGVLLAEPGNVVTKLPNSEDTEPGRPAGVQATRGGSPDSGELGGSIAAALAVVSLGALRERRRVRLRVA